MKRKLLVACAVLTGLISVAAFADETTTTTTTVATPAGAVADNDPCKTIAMACQAAGYSVNASVQGKSLINDCLTPIIRGGQAPSDVNVSQADIQACMAKIPGGVRQPAAPAK